MPNAIPQAPVPQLPALNPINHQAAGLDLGCANCTMSAVRLGEVKARPWWVNFAAAAGVLGAFAGVALIASRKQRRRGFAGL